jgi:hypothetical protein
MKVVSGGQTGVDRAALDAAVTHNIQIGGWCPLGRLAEDGRIPDCYPLVEMPTRNYPARTEKNVVESDATLVLTMGHLSRGTALTQRLTARFGKPSMTLDLRTKPESGMVASWKRSHNIAVLNVAGPRESGSPGVYDVAKRFLESIFAQLSELP